MRKEAESAMQIKQTPYKDIEPMILVNILENKITVDSFWEDHILKSNHYGIYEDSVMVGYFSIFEKNTITSFYMIESHAQFGRKLMDQIKHFEQVTNAMVPTGDEFFLSHCTDSFSRMEKQAYFSIYRETSPAGFQNKALHLVRMDDKADLELLKKAEDFFDNDPVDRIFDPSPYYRIYKAFDQGELVGFGIVETGRVDPCIASIGMYVMADKRQHGYAKNILRQLQEKIAAEGYAVRSGCWYYNHNSLKSIESAGGYSKTRLLRFYF
jgi:GNAT superfamily N-acetyltransferase